MNRSDERKQLKPGLGGSMARSPAAARAAEKEHVTTKVSHEHDEREGAEGSGEGAGMARSPHGTRGDTERDQAKQHHEMHEDREEVSGGRGIKHVSVDADHVIGDGGAIGNYSAEGEPDMASAGANRKEAMEPERERNEKAAIGREREVAHKNTMGHGERETKACHTI